MDDSGKAEKMREKKQDFYESLMDALDGMFFSILQVDPAADRVLILQSRDHPQQVQKTMVWTDLLKNYSDLVTAQGKTKLWERLSCEALQAEAESGEDSFMLDVSYIKKGRTNWLSIMVRMVEKDGGFCAYVFVRRNNEEHLKKMQLRAQTDTLTELLNYRGIIDHVEEALLHRSGKSAFLFIDLDNFGNQVNDTMGHQAGDRLLRRVGRVLRTQSGKDALQGRVGGDEFVVFLPQIRDHGHARDCARRICEMVEQLTLPMNGSPTISCSIGIAVAPEDGRDYLSLSKCADRRAYHAKSLGKNRFFPETGRSNGEKFR